MKTDSRMKAFIRTILIGCFAFIGVTGTSLALERSALAFPAYFAGTPGSACPEPLPDGSTGYYQSDGRTCCPQGTTSGDSCLFAKYVNPAINFLSALVGIAVVASIIVGAIQYITSEGDPQKAAAGKKRITEALIGLGAFIVLYALLQFLVPGGLV